MTVNEPSIDGMCEIHSEKPNYCEIAALTVPYGCKGGAVQITIAELTL